MGNCAIELCLKVLGVAHVVACHFVCPRVVHTADCLFLLAWTLRLIPSAPIAISVYGLLLWGIFILQVLISDSRMVYGGWSLFVC